MELTQDAVFNNHGRISLQLSDEHFEVFGMVDGEALKDKLVTFRVVLRGRGHRKRARAAIREWGEVREAKVDCADRSSVWAVVPLPDEAGGRSQLDWFYLFSRELFETVHSRIYGAILTADARYYQTHPE